MRIQNFNSLVVGAVLLIIAAASPNAYADIKVAKYSPCEKSYFSMAKTIRKLSETHYAVATTGGRSLKAGGTSCGFSDGFDSAGFHKSAALKECSKSKKKFGDPGECRIIESK